MLRLASVFPLGLCEMTVTSEKVGGVTYRWSEVYKVIKNGDNFDQSSEVRQ